jgi:hypothetical protein
VLWHGGFMSLALLVLSVMAGSFELPYKPPHRKNKYRDKDYTGQTIEAALNIRYRDNDYRAI